jgi:hypothetical protein
MKNERNASSLPAGIMSRLQKTGSHFINEGITDLIYISRQFFAEQVAVIQDHLPFIGIKVQGIDLVRRKQGGIYSQCP